MISDNDIKNLFERLNEIEKSCNKENCMKLIQEYDYVMSVIHNMLQVKRYDFTKQIDKLATEYFKELKEKKEN